MPTISWPRSAKYATASELRRPAEPVTMTTDMSVRCTPPRLRPKWCDETLVLADPVVDRLERLLRTPPWSPARIPRHPRVVRDVQPDIGRAFLRDASHLHPISCHALTPC